MKKITGNESESEAFLVLLEKINSPEQLKQLPVEELPRLAEEIRRFLIESLSVPGVLLSSALGAAAPTLARDELFDSPRDKILSDVGHQAYTHKILTGRREACPTLRR